MCGGANFEATIVAAAPSTKNPAKQRYLEMKQTKTGNQLYFSMKAHIGVDTVTGLTHRVVSTSASVTDVTTVSHFVHDENKRIFGDTGDAGI